ncbi:MAG: lysylphosphatidylglycerol synthase domain-containing protein [Candidatus Acidiferrales bacterium]
METTANAPAAAMSKVLVWWRRLGPPLVTAAIFYYIFQRIPLARLVAAFDAADLPRFLALMLPNSVLYFAWDTLVLACAIRWFHGPIRYRDLLPVRAVSYVVSLANTNLARATVAYYLKRQLGDSFLVLAGTVILLTLLEFTHLILWAVAGMVFDFARMRADLMKLIAGLLAFWMVFLLYVRGGAAPWRAVTGRIAQRWPVLRGPQWYRGGRLRVREWKLLRTFVTAPLRRWVQIILLRAPMFFTSLVFHWLAVRTFGIEIPFLQMMAFLPVIFMLAALPVTVMHLGTTQAAWIFFFSDYAAPAQLLAYSLASHFTFMFARGALGLLFLPRAWRDLAGPVQRLATGATSTHDSVHQFS